MRLRSINNMIESESKIVTAMVVSTEFLREVAPIYKKEYFQGDYTRIVAEWIMDYFSKYRECPSRHIEDIYALEKGGLKEADAELVSTFLQGISDRYEQEGEKLNVAYYLDMARQYFSMRSIQSLAENLTALVGAGRNEGAERLIKQYASVSKSLSPWVNPFDEAYLEEVWKSHFGEVAEEDRPGFLFKLSGALGELIGGLRRGWLVAIEGPYKRGKTFWQMEFAAQALMDRCRVAFISLEMEHDDVSARLYRILTAFAEEAGTYLCPCFDCRHNQDGSCTRSERTNSVSLFADGKGRPDYDQAPAGYKPCTACTGQEGGTPTFKLATWWEPITHEAMTIKALKGRIKGFERFKGNNLRVLAYPAYSATFSMVTQDLERLEYEEEFVPDVIVIDYIDILAPEDKRLEYRHRIDELWKMAKSLAATRHALVLTATQTNKQAGTKQNVTAQDVAEEGRKLGHVDVMVALNQEEEEKEQGVMRISVVMHRHRMCSKYRQVTVLQNLSLGQVVLDSQ